MANASKIDYHNFDATAALTIAAWSVAGRFMYEQATPETRMLIAQALDELAGDLASRGVIYASKSSCCLHNDQIVFEIMFSETPSDVLKPKKVEIRLNCG